MAALYVEVWGVFLGFAVPCMGGLLVVPHGCGTLGWTWGYRGPVEALVSIHGELSNGRGK